MRWGRSTEDYSGPWPSLPSPRQVKQHKHSCGRSSSAPKYPPRCRLAPLLKFTIHYSFLWLAEVFSRPGLDS